MTNPADSSRLIDRAITVVHQVPKSASWISLEATRIIDACEDPAIARRAEAIRNLAEGMSGAAMCFLESTTSEAGQSAQTTTLASAIGEAIREANRQHPDRFVVTEVRSGDNLPVDRRLRDVLSNLLDNAMNSDVDGFPVILTAEAHRGELALSVTDSGTGMSAEVLESCTRQGFSTRTDGLGCGMGLTVVQRTLEALGGSFEISTTESVGTRVTVRVPRTHHPVSGD